MIENIKHIHPFIQHYYEYLTETFCQYLAKLPSELYNRNNYNLLEDGQAQEFIISDIYRRLEGKLDYLLFKTGSSYGRPWTQLDFACKENIYNNESEYIFWRVDMRSNMFYIRMNQWAEIDPLHREHKFQYRDRLRKIASALSKKYDLVEGDLNNKGLKESEIVIYFLDKNKLIDLVEQLPLLSVDFYTEYIQL